jgi:tubulin-folding cofactor B
MDNITVLTEDFVKVIITISSSDTYNVERSFAKSLTIGDLKGKLELMTGGNAKTMQLNVVDKAGNPVCILDSDTSLLGSFPIDSGMTIHVKDNFTTRNEFDSCDQVAKFELADEEYAQRTDTVRAHLERNKLGRFDPEREEQLRREREAIEALEQQLADKLKIGDRCEVPGNRRGTIKYVGEVNFQKGKWVGIQLDEPVGKNDGSVGDQQYFTCPPKYGSFVKVTNVKTGDFPEEDPFADDEI